MTIELVTGIDRTPDPLDYGTKVAGCAVAKEGTPCPLWLAFLDRVTDGNAELIGFLKRFLGYCLTGHVNERRLYGCLFLRIAFERSWCLGLPEQ